MDETVIKNLIVVPINFDDKKYQDDYTYASKKAVRLDLELFSKKHLEINRKPINSIFTSSKMKNILMRCFNTINFKMLITKPNNDKKYNQYRAEESDKLNQMFAILLSFIGEQQSL